jgi:hypothetical protein
VAALGLCGRGPHHRGARRHGGAAARRRRFGWDEDRLVYAVREPWPSKTTGAALVYGVITRDRPLVIASHMAENGVIFSDGVEADYLGFTSGLTATIAVADRHASLIMPSA